MENRFFSVSKIVLFLEVGTYKVIIMRLGTLAQLGERLVRNEEVGGSIPLCSTSRLISVVVVQIRPSSLGQSGSSYGIVE